MDHSEGTSSGRSRLGGLGALLPGAGLAGSYTPTPITNTAQISVQAEEDEEEEKEEEEKEKEGRKDSDPEPRLFRISSIGSSEFSASGPPVSRPVIHIQEESEAQGSPLFPRMDAAEKRRAQELAGASLPPFLPPPGQQQDSPTTATRRLGSSVEPPRGYGAIPVGIQTESGSRSPSPQRHNKMRKTISGMMLLGGVLIGQVS